MDEFDFVIVGGGTAASIIAYRVSAEGHSVCVLEAGPRDWNPYIRIPAGFIKTLFDPELTWQLASEPSPNTNHRAIQYTQGKTLGGSGAVNGMVINRGQAADFNHWAQLGNSGWSYADVLPYFKRTERRIGDGDDVYRGREGFIPVTTSLWPNKVADAFIASARDLGHAYNADYNGATQEGVGYYQSAIHRGRRVSPAHAYLHPARRLLGVDVRPRSLVTRILIENKHATGVIYRRDGQDQEVRARLGVIVSAGAINTPKLLQLSGVGPVELLSSHGIEIAQAAPGVGRNLRDHYSPRLVARAKAGVDTLNAHVAGAALLLEGVRWLMGAPSVLKLSPALIHVFGKSEPKLTAPDYSLVFTPGSYKQGFIGRLDDSPGMTCGAWQMRPESAGYVRIRSVDPNVAPIINPNYLTEEIDRTTLVKALKKARAILSAPPLARFVEREQFPGSEVSSDDEWLAFAREHGNSSYHLVGTCKMGRADDPMATLDERLRVRGVAGLRVADASIMPSMPSANTYASTMMIAEKAADMILEDIAAQARGKAA